MTPDELTNLTTKDWLKHKLNLPPNRGGMDYEE